MSTSRLTLSVQHLTQSTHDAIPAMLDLLDKSDRASWDAYGWPEFIYSKVDRGFVLSMPEVADFSMLPTDLTRILELAASEGATSLLFSNKGKKIPSLAVHRPDDEFNVRLMEFDEAFPQLQHYLQ